MQPKVERVRRAVDIEKAIEAVVKQELSLIHTHREVAKATIISPTKKIAAARM